MKPDELKNFALFGESSFAFWDNEKDDEYAVFYKDVAETLN